jgi:hypothetical protein
MRDKEIVRIVNDYRVIRQEHIEKLLFHSKSSKNTAQKRLWLLWQNGFLKREFLPVLGGIQNSPILYLVDTQGVDLLQTEFGYTKQDLRYTPHSPGSQFLRHTLGLSDIRVAFTLSSYEHDYTVRFWNDETAMKARFDRVPVSNRLVSLIPDAHFALWIGSKCHHHFLEFDRGPERLKVYEHKLKAYERYMETGMFFNHYKSTSIRILTVVEGNKTRLDNFRKMVENSPRRNHFGFTTLDCMTTSNVYTVPIWYAAGKVEPLALVEQS